MKKIILVAILAGIVVLAAGAAAYMYWPGAKTPQDSVNITQEQETPVGQEEEIIEPIVPATDEPSFTICSWQCGDGVCQKTQVSTCENGENCVCLEAPENCPADCPGN